MIKQAEHRRYGCLTLNIIITIRTVSLRKRSDIFIEVKLTL